jgi:hypothetical protein
MTKMNKNIEDIELLAMNLVMNGEDPDGDVDDMYIPAEFTRKFAELLIRECADQIVAKGTDQVDFAPSQTGVRPEYWDMAQHIKQHFGVK